MREPVQHSSSGAMAARIMVATCPLGAMRRISAGSSTSRPQESVNTAGDGAVSTVTGASSAGAAVSAGAVVSAAGAAPQAASPRSRAIARSRENALLLMVLSFRINIFLKE